MPVAATIWRSSIALDAEPALQIMANDFPELLLGALWHTTHLERYMAILKSGFIVPNPEIPDTERWKTRNGPDTYPYVRHLNGVSIFDFTSFDPICYSNAFPMSDWRTFVPLRKNWGASVWIEVDIELIEGQYLDPQQLAKLQKAENAERHTLMPRIEAAVIGRIPLSAFKRTLIRRNGVETFEPLGKV